MKRDIDLIRNLLLLIESHPQANAPEIIEIPGYGKDVTNYHLTLLLDAGLVEGTVSMVVGQDYPEVRVYWLTWAGHDFLETAREETVWRRAMTILADKGVSITLDVLRGLLASLARTAVGL